MPIVPSSTNTGATTLLSIRVAAMGFKNDPTLLLSKADASRSTRAGSRYTPPSRLRTATTRGSLAMMRCTYTKFSNFPLFLLLMLLLLLFTFQRCAGSAGSAAANKPQQRREDEAPGLPSSSRNSFRGPTRPRPATRLSRFV